MMTKKEFSNLVMSIGELDETDGYVFRPKASPISLEEALLRMEDLAYTQVLCRAAWLRTSYSFMEEALEAAFVELCPNGISETDTGRTKCADDNYAQIHLKSLRGFPLSWIWKPLADQTVVCVEIYVKWYRLQLIHPDGSIGDAIYPDDYVETGETPYLDHAPNPMVVQRWAAKQGFYLCDMALELLIGRWEQEFKNNYHYDPEEAKE